LRCAGFVAIRPYRRDMQNALLRGAGFALGVAFSVLLWWAEAVGEWMIRVAVAFRWIAACGPLLIPLAVLLAVLWAPIRAVFHCLRSAAVLCHWMATRLDARSV
jgi:hypothetical protein